jgi:Cytochrome c7 and related cytochrome c
MCGDGVDRGKRAATWLLAALLLAGGLSAACGGAGSLPPSAPASTTPLDTPSPSSSTSTPTPTSTSAPTPTTLTTTPAPTGQAHVEMKAPLPTAMAGDLLAIGLDVANLPPIEKLPPTALRRVMKLFTRSLGVQCADCHARQESGEVASFAAPTRRKKIASKMWDELVVRLQVSADGSGGGGAPLFCDSCHQGRVVQLDRSDKKALGDWMQASFVDRLSRKDGTRHDCETCHVGREMHLLAKWGGG